MKLNYDGLIKIAVGKKRSVMRWDAKSMLFSELVEQLSQSVATGETMAEYAKMNKTEQVAIKDVGGFVGGTLREGVRKANSVTSRSLICLDADYAGASFWDDAKIFFDNAIVVYSTHSHTAGKPRLRLIIPLSREVSVEEYEALARKVANDLGMDAFDPTTFEPSRLMFWPSHSADAVPFFDYIDAPFINPDAALAQYENWKDVRSWPVAKNEVVVHERLMVKQGDPLEKQGIVGAFCRALTIQDAIAKYLSDVYAPDASGRYSYLAGSTSCGLVTYDDKFAYSHHATDPARGQLCNAFDLLRIHLFGELDRGINEQNRGNQRPSYQAMVKLANEDEECKKQLTLETFNTAIEQGQLSEDDTDWLKQLDYSGKKIESSYKNVMLIFTNDANLKELFYFDEMANNIGFNRNVGWRTANCTEQLYLTDNDLKQLRCYLGSVYKIQNEKVTRDCLVNIALRQKRHPLREWLTSNVWDGRPRLSSLFIDVLGAVDEPYTREVTKKALLSAMKRIFEPGCKADSMLVLIGPQGCGKSSLISALARFPRYFANVSNDVEGKSFMEIIRGKWLVEMEEMASIKNSSVERLKSILSSQQDTYRPAYAEVAGDFPRQGIFIGTTNSFSFLKDDTGNRRFWPLEVAVNEPARRVVIVEKHNRKRLDAIEFENYINQIWAEAYAMYQEGEVTHYFTPEELAKYGVTEKQESVTETDVWETLIAEFLAKRISPDWYTLPIMTRRMLMQAYDENKNDLSVVRMRVCTKEIWCECLGFELTRMEKYHGDRISNILIYKFGARRGTTARFGRGYGIQKCFELM